MNADDHMERDGWLKKFADNTKDKDAEDRATVLEGDTEVLFVVRFCFFLVLVFFVCQKFTQRYSSKMRDGHKDYYCTTILVEISSLTLFPSVCLYLWALENLIGVPRLIFFEQSLRITLTHTRTHVHTHTHAHTHTHTHTRTHSHTLSRTHKYRSQAN